MSRQTLFPVSNYSRGYSVSGEYKNQGKEVMGGKQSCRLQVSSRKSQVADCTLQERAVSAKKCIHPPKKVNPS